MSSALLWFTGSTEGFKRRVLIRVTGGRRMQARSFDYVRPATVAKAIQVLSEYGNRAKVLAGGQSLIPVLKLRLANPQMLVDINGLPGLSFIEERGDRLRIGALSRHRDFGSSKLVRSKYPILADAAASLGDPQVRNLGTIGGALAHADPASDWGTTLLAFETELVANGPKGTRTIPIDGFFKDTFTTALRPAELLTEIRIPKAGPGNGGAYLKLKRKTGDFATVGVAVQMALDPKRTVRGIRIALAAAGPTPVRAASAEKELTGKHAGPAAFAEAAKVAAQGAKPEADLRGSVEYKRAMIEVFTRRALETAASRAGR
jgi:carbon-monoxide dehydrogenase medium subunit